MTRFKIQELRSIESGAGSPGTLRQRIEEVILSSSNCRARVETLNPDTGEYSIVLQGTLDRSETPWDSR
jgi:hypothetical protein